MRKLAITASITQRESRAIEKYLQEINKVSLITPEEEVELAQRIRKGDQVALEKLTKANLRFVVSVAKQYQNRGLPLDDLINEGNLGLIRAAQKFDETKGFKFISYAVWWIRQGIQQALSEQARMVRLPSNKIEDLNKINQAFYELEQKYEREPTAEELSELLELNCDDIKKIRELHSRHQSIDAPLGDDDEGYSLSDVLRCDEFEEADSELQNKISLKIELESSLAILKDREKEVVKMYYGLDAQVPLCLEDIGTVLGLTQERVRQIKDKALRRLRTKGSKALKGYL